MHIYNIKRIIFSKFNYILGISNMKTINKKLEYQYYSNHVKSRNLIETI